MTLFEIISEDIKKAMLAKDKTALDALRGVKKEFLEAKTAKGSDGELHDDQAVKILQKMVKQRKESAEMYLNAGRTELAEKERAEVTVIEHYLPVQMDDTALTAAVLALITEVGATSLQDLGKVMGLASKRLAGQADGKAISAKVKELLSAQ